MLTFVALSPQIVSGSRASRSLASLGRLGRAKLGAAPDAAASDSAAVEASAADGAFEAGATDAGAGAPLAAGIGVAAAPQPHRTVTSTPDASAAARGRRIIESPPEWRPDGHGPATLRCSLSTIAEPAVSVLGRILDRRLTARAS